MVFVQFLWLDELKCKELVIDLRMEITCTLANNFIS